jgi:hypothetical protein
LVLFIVVAAASSIILAIIAAFAVRRWREKRVLDDENHDPEADVSTISRKFGITQLALSKSKLKLVSKLDSGGFGEVFLIYRANFG